MKRSFSFYLTASGIALIATTYGLARFAWGLHLPGIQADLGFDATRAGMIFAGGSLAYCIGALAGFLLAPRRPRLLVALAGLTAALGTAGIAAAPSIAVLAPAAVLASTGAGLASPALVRIVQRNMRTPAAERTQSVVNAGTGPGLIAAGLLALVLLPEWRSAWWLASAASVVTAVAVLVFDRGRASVTAAGLPGWSWWRRHAVVIAGSLLLGAGSAAVWTYGRTMLDDAGLPARVTVLIWVALGAGGLAVIPTAGLISRLSPPRAWMLPVTVLALATSAIVIMPSSTPIVLATGVVFGWAYVAATGALIGWTAAIEPTRAASGTALLFVLLVLGQAIGGAALGPIVDSAGYAPAFFTAAAAALAAAGAGAIGGGRPGSTVDVPSTRRMPAGSRDARAR